MSLHGIDYAIIVLYFVFVLGIGWALKRFMKTSLDFFESGRSLAAWITALAFISANLGAQGGGARLGTPLSSACSAAYSRRPSITDSPNRTAR